MRELRAARLKQRQKRFQPREGFLALRPGARIVGAEEHVVAYREERKEAPALENMRNAHARAAMGGQALDALSLERDAARARAQQSRDRIDERGLAGAVRAEDSDDFARGHVKRGFPQDLELAVGNVQRFDRKLSHATYAWPR